MMLGMICISYSRHSKHRNKATAGIESGSGGNKGYWYQCLQLHLQTTDVLEDEDLYANLGASTKV